VVQRFHKKAVGFSRRGNPTSSIERVSNEVASTSAAKSPSSQSNFIAALEGLRYPKESARDENSQQSSSTFSLASENGSLLTVAGPRLSLSPNFISNATGI
jgi:hypothetical protein